MTLMEQRLSLVRLIGGSSGRECYNVRDMVGEGLSDDNTYRNCADADSEP